MTASTATAGWDGAEASRDPACAPAGFELWISPDGIPHLVPVKTDRGPVQEPVTGPCVTCGRHHQVLHFRNVRVYADQYQHLPDGTRCVTQVQDWPYECAAKDAHPDHIVYRCVPHGVWWHQPG